MPKGIGYKNFNMNGIKVFLDKAGDKAGDKVASMRRNKHNNRKKKGKA